ncbi:MAG: hypothetical protein ACTSPY_09045 [Candidatus Helarchaeota archaeon]
MSRFNDIEVNSGVKPRESGGNNEDNIIKCPRCGYSIKRNGFLCPFCNSLNDYNSYFCKICGNRIKQPDGKYIQKYSEIKVGVDSKKKIVYTVKIWGKDKFKIASDENKNENENAEEEISVDELKYWKINDGKCNNCLTKISDRLLKLMEKGYKVRCEVCDHELN